MLRGINRGAKISTKKTQSLSDKSQRPFMSRAVFFILLSPSAAFSPAFNGFYAFMIDQQLDRSAHDEGEDLASPE